MSRVVLILLVLALCTAKTLAQQPMIKTSKSVRGQKVKKPVVRKGQKSPVSETRNKNAQLVQPVAPLVLPVQNLSFERLTSREIWHNPRVRHLAQASAERFVRFSGEDDSTHYGVVWKPSKPALLYRKNRSDSVWTVINLILPDYANHETRGRLDWEGDGFRWIDIIKIDTLNLDGLGEPEVLISVFRDCCGTVVHTEYMAINLIDVNEVPKLLLSALIETRDSGGYDSDGNGFEASYVQRTVKPGPDLLVGRIITNRPGWENLLTPLKSGRYQYRDGHLVWVGK